MRKKCLRKSENSKIIRIFAAIKQSRKEVCESGNIRHNIVELDALVLLL